MGINMIPAPKNHYRERIISEGLLYYLDSVSLSDRNKKMVRFYVEGKSYIEIAKMFGISAARVPQIVHNYILHCSRIINILDDRKDYEIKG